MIDESLDGATPLDPGEAKGLKLTHITTREELDRWEHDNIAQADAYYAGRRLGADGLLSEGFLRTLHRRMFGDVWDWAGQFRKTEKSIGIDPTHIAVAVHDLCENTKTWIEYGTYPPDEIAVRFHHRLVAIHPFVNGNGRHARLATDLLLQRVLGRPRFTWGGAALTDENEVRYRYISALRAADRGDYSLLDGFVRS